MREAGSTAVQEVAFTLGNGIAYVQAAVCAGLEASTARSVKLKFPPALGTPAMAPLVESSARPAGSAPEAIDQA